MIFLSSFDIFLLLLVLPGGWVVDHGGLYEWRVHASVDCELPGLIRPETDLLVRVVLLPKSRPKLIQ